MIGQWLRFGEGEPPQDGELLVWLRLGAIRSMFEYVPALHQWGTLFEQGGASYPIPYGMLWTSLPAPRTEPAMSQRFTHVVSFGKPMP